MVAFRKAFVAVRWVSRLTSESVESTSLPLQSVDNIHSGDCLPLCVLSVSDGITDDILKEHFENGTGLLVDQSRNTLDSTIYSGKENIHEHGVAIIMSKESANSLISWTPVSERIITARFNSRHIKTTVIQVYAPHNEAPSEEKDSFYERRGIYLPGRELNPGLPRDRRGNSCKITSPRPGIEPGPPA